MVKGKELGDSGSKRGKSQREPLRTAPKGKRRENPPDDPRKFDPMRHKFPVEPGIPDGLEYKLDVIIAKIYKILLAIPLGLGFLCCGILFLSVFVFVKPISVPRLFSATETPTPTSTSTPTPTSIPTQTPVPTESLTCFQNLGTTPVRDDAGNEVDDPRVQIKEVCVNENQIDVIIKEAGGEKDFSFAVAIQIQLDNQIFALYIWEMHDGSTFIGQIDPNSEDIIPGTEGLITVQELEDGTLKVSVQLSEWPDQAEVEILVGAFHTKESTDLRAMHDFTTPRFAPPD